MGAWAHRDLADVGIDRVVDGVGDDRRAGTWAARRGP